MPRLCSFYGIVIAMFYNDHPPAHFHATYVGEEIRVNIDTLEILSGSLTRRAGDGLGVGVAAPRRPRGVLGAPRAHQPLGTIDPLPWQEDAMLTTAARLRGARAGSARTIELSFSDGSSRRVDVEPLLWGPVFAEIAGNDEAFAELFVDAELGTVCWPNGADIASETLLGLPDIGRD